MSLLKLTACLLVVGTLAGCTTIKGWLERRDDGSLDYQSATKLDPIKLPADTQTAAFVPFYNTPSTGQNTLELTNSTGKQYELPKPPTIQSTP